METIKVREARDEKDFFCGDRGDTYYYLLANDDDEGFILGCNEDIDIYEDEVYLLNIVSNNPYRERLFEVEVTEGELSKNQLRQEVNIKNFDGLYIAL